MPPSKSIIDKMNHRNDDYCRRLINDKVLITRKDFNRTSKNKTSFRNNVIWDYPATAITSYDSNGNYVKSNYSRNVFQTSYNSILTKRLNSINPPRTIGDSNGGTIIGHCAEPHAANQVMNAYSKAKHKDLPLEDVFFSLARRPRTMEIIPTCQNCKDTFPNL